MRMRIKSIAGPSPIINFYEHAHNEFTSTTPRVLHFSAIHGGYDFDWKTLDGW